jgi:hypothetical protein
VRLVLVALLASGLHGTVMRGPTMPVCMVGVPCSEPAAGAVLVFTRRDRVAARVRTDAHGRYRVSLRPGLYAVRLPATPRLGAGLAPRSVRVPRGANARVDFMIDTGIR